MAKMQSGFNLGAIVGAISEAVQSLSPASSVDKLRQGTRRHLTFLATSDFLNLYHEKLSPGRSVVSDSLKRSVRQRIQKIIIEEMPEGNEISDTESQALIECCTRDVILALIASGVPVVENKIESQRAFTRSVVLEFLAIYSEIPIGSGIHRGKLKRLIERRIAEILLAEQEKTTRFSKPKALTKAHHLSEGILSALVASGLPIGD